MIIRITETLVRDVEVSDSLNEEEALEMVDKLYSNSEIILNSDDFSSVEMEVIYEG